VAGDRDLFANFERMRREIDELFGDVFGRSALGTGNRGGFSPPVDVGYAQDPPRAIVTAALSGVRLEEIELEISGRRLRIAGRRRPAESEELVYQQIEIQYGPFERTVELGTDVVAERTRATLVDGMLRVELPLANVEARSVAVQIGHGPGAEDAAAAGENRSGGPQPEGDAGPTGGRR
jgi:HSP20 family protein